MQDMPVLKHAQMQNMLVPKFAHLPKYARTKNIQKHSKYVCIAFVSNKRYAIIQAKKCATIMKVIIKIKKSTEIQKVLKIRIIRRTWSPFC